METKTTKAINSKATFIGTKSLLRLSLFFSFFVSLLFLQPKASCQDISSPRFFEFNVQPTAASNTPVIPNATTGVLPQTKPNYNISSSLRFPIKLEGNTKIIGELKYKNESLNGFYSISDDQFQQLEFNQTKGSIILFSQLNDRLRFTNMLSASSSSTDFISLDSRALRFRNISMIEKTLANGTEVGIGAAFSYDDNFMVIPFLKYKKEFNNDWALEAILPKSIELTKDLSLQSRLSFGLKSKNTNYTIGNQQMANAYATSARYKHMEIAGIVGYQKQITPWIGFEVEVGASMPLRSGIYAADSNQTKLYDINGGIRPYFNVGFFLSLPR